MPAACLAGIIGFSGAQQRAALNPGAMKQTAGLRHRHQGADFSAAAGLAENHHVPRIAAEICNVIAHPLKDRNNIQHAHIRRTRIALIAEFGKVEIAE